MQADPNDRSGALWLVAALGIAFVYGFNLLFYTGSDLGHFQWKLEQGRFSLEMASNLVGEDFHVAGNSQHLRFDVDAKWRNASHWLIALPLWIPLVLVTILWIRAQLRRRK